MPCAGCPTRKPLVAALVFLGPAFVGALPRHSEGQSSLGLPRWLVRHVLHFLLDCRNSTAILKPEPTAFLLHTCTVRDGFRAVLRRDMGHRDVVSKTFRGQLGIPDTGDARCNGESQPSLIPLL